MSPSFIGTGGPKKAGGSRQCQVTLFHSVNDPIQRKYMGSVLDNTCNETDLADSERGAMNPPSKHGPLSHFHLFLYHDPDI